MAEIKAKRKVSMASVVSGAFAKELVATDRGATKLQLPKGSGGRLSPTQMNMWLKCGMMYWFRYGEGIKKPPAVAMIEGSAHHKALEVNNNHHVEQGVNLSPDELLSVFNDDFSTRKKNLESGVWDGEPEGVIRDRAEGLIKRYVGGFAQDYAAEESEQRFEAKVGDVPVLGIVDTVGDLNSSVLKGKKHRVVVDYKITGKAKAQSELDGSLQLSMYGWSKLKGTRKRSITAGFCCLKKTKVPAVQWQPVQIGVARVLWFQRIVLSVADGISRGAFPLCNPESWWCCEKWCGYWHLCRGAK